MHFWLYKYRKSETAYLNIHTQQEPPHKTPFIYKKHKHSKNENSTIYKATRIWNKIPLNIRNQDTQDKFKNTLQAYITQQTYT